MTEEEAKTKRCPIWRVGAGPREELREHIQDWVKEAYVEGWEAGSDPYTPMDVQQNAEDGRISRCWRVSKALKRLQTGEDQPQ